MNNFLIYRSSAGSGKTYTLVKEYLKLILNDTESFKNVLAVTFTNKSTSEMKSRIISSLVKLSRGEDAALKKTLTDEGVKGDIEISSNVILKNILHKYSYFSVSTIDSFFHKVIRSFARELKLQLGYNIELDQQAVLDKITDKLLDDAGIDKDLTGFLQDFMYYSIDDEKDISCCNENGNWSTNNEVSEYDLFLRPKTVKKWHPMLRGCTFDSEQECKTFWEPSPIFIKAVEVEVNEE